MLRKSVALDLGTYTRLVIYQAILQNRKRKKLSLSKTIDSLLNLAKVKK